MTVRSPVWTWCAATPGLRPGASSPGSRPATVTWTRVDGLGPGATRPDPDRRGVQVVRGVAAKGSRSQRAAPARTVSRVAVGPIAVAAPAGAVSASLVRRQIRAALRYAFERFAGEGEHAAVVVFGRHSVERAAAWIVDAEHAHPHLRRHPHRRVLHHGLRPVPQTAHRRTRPTRTAAATPSEYGLSTPTSMTTEDSSVSPPELGSRIRTRSGSGRADGVRDP